MKKYDQYRVEDFLKDELFVKWVRGQHDEAKVFWQSWLAQNPGKREEVQRAREIIISAQKRSVPVATEKDYADVLEGILKHSAFDKEKEKKEKNSTTWKHFRYLAASIAMAVGCYLLYLAFAIPSNNLTENIGTKEALAFITKEVPLGQKQLLTLTDGTKVKLNAGTKFSYPVSFKHQEKREVILHTGEAFFEVARNEKHPFVITSAKSVTEVLGTSFNIKTNDERTDIAVISGKVKVSSKEEVKDAYSKKNKEVFLGAGEGVVITKESDIFSKNAINLEEVVSWKDGVIYFNNASFKDVEEKLSAWYGVVFENKIKVKGAFSGRFKDKTLADVLDGLQYISPFNYKIISDKVIIY